MIASPATICSALGGAWRGSSGMCMCPAHDDSGHHLIVSQTADRRPLVRCTAGCSDISVIGALRAKRLWPELHARFEPAFLEEIRLRTALSGLIGSSVNLKRVGHEFSGLCDFHNEKSPSFFVNDDKGFYHCFGCGAHGDAFAWVMHKTGATFRDVVEDLAAKVGLLPDSPLRQGLVHDPASPHRLTIARDPEGLSQDDLARQESARRLWDHTIPIAGTLAGIYLKARGIRVRLPDTIRFHPRLRHTETQQHWPCMVAAIHDSAGRVTAIQRTYLEPDGRDRIRPADGSKGKKTLGPMGNGAVRLGTPYGVLGLAEGIETALSAKQLYGVTVWATLSAHRLGSIWIPEGIEEIWIFADAGRVGLKEAQEAVSGYADAGYRCLIQLPPDGLDDHNAALMCEAVA